MKRDEITAIDNLNAIKKCLWSIEGIAESLYTLGMEKAADRLQMAVNAIEGLAEEAKGDISEAINNRYNQSQQEAANIIKTCLGVNKE